MVGPFGAGPEIAYSSAYARKPVRLPFHGQDGRATTNKVCFPAEDGRVHFRFWRNGTRRGTPWAGQAQPLQVALRRPIQNLKSKIVRSGSGF